MIRWGIKGKASVLVDGQFGSTGKGLIAAWLAHQIERPLDVATCNAGAQAGHTTRYRSGHNYVCFHLPTSAIVRTEALAYVNAGSIIDIEAFKNEIEALGIDPARIAVHPRAAMISKVDRDAEHEAGSSTERTASTQKGVGHALTRKIMRKAALAQDCFSEFPPGVRIERLDLNQLLLLGHSVTVEVPQGFDLSLNHGYAYPYTTSRDCTVSAGVSDAGIHPSFVGPVAMVIRTFPIRVGAIYNELGEKLGDSGPFYEDSVELDWTKDFPGIEPERTTVTKRVRRIATFSTYQYERAASMNRPTILCLNFCNYLKSTHELTMLVQKIERINAHLDLNPTMLFGFGPCTEDIADSYARALSWFKDRRPTW